MFTIENPTISKLKKAINIYLDSNLVDTKIDIDEINALVDDLNWSLYRLEEAPKQSKLICVHDEKVPDNLKVEEGFWIINDKAYYLAVPR